MKEIKSKTINFKILLFALSFLFFFISTNDLNSLNLYVLSIVISLIGLAFYQITLDKQGIVKKKSIISFFENY
jgi:threonine/homoserine/homoserine lactone efflux protein